MNVQTNLYTRLVEAATGKFRAELDRINAQLGNINRAERIAGRLRAVELDATAEACAGNHPFIVLRLPAEVREHQRYAIKYLAKVLERKVVANGKAAGGDCYAILPRGEERTSLELVVKAI